MLRLLSVLLALAALVAAAAGVFWLFAPVAHYRASIEAAVLKATGRQLLIEGPVSVVFAPGVALDLGPVRLSGLGGGDIMRAANAVVEVEFLPLLSGRVRISRLTLTGADLSIGPRSIPEPLNDGAPANIAPLRLGEVRLVTSLVHLADETRDIAFTAQDLMLAWPRDGASLSATGLIDIGGESFDVEAATGQPGALLSGAGQLPLTVRFEGPLAKGSLEGSVDLAAFAYDGLINLTTPSARRILSAYGVTIPGDRGLHSLSVAATLRAQPGLAQLRGAKFALDATTGAGALGLRIEGGRLALAGTLSVDQIDSATYLAFEEPAGAEGAHGWSEAAADLSGLRELDLDLQINARRATLAGIALAGVDAELVSRRGRAELAITRAQVNAGTLAARVTADVTGETPVIALDTTVAAFDAQALFGSALGSEALTGRGDLIVRLRGRGASEAELVRTLNGGVALTLTGGSLDGIDLPAVARSVAASAARDDAPAATNVRTLSVSFAVKDGIATTSDLALSAPFVDFTGSGTFGLAARTLRVRLTPRPSGDGGPPGLSIPFAALGPWEAPVFVADWQALREMAVSGAIPGEALAGLPQPAADWFAGVVAGNRRLPDLPPVPGAAAPPDVSGPP